MAARWTCAANLTGQTTTNATILLDRQTVASKVEIQEWEYQVSGSSGTVQVIKLVRSSTTTTSTTPYALDPATSGALSGFATNLAYTAQGVSLLEVAHAASARGFWFIFQSDVYPTIYASSAQPSLAAHSADAADLGMTLFIDEA